jgi:hydrogenase expression/formation protein HypC
MCIAIPARVLEVCGMNARVERYGERLEVSLLLLADEEVAPGDYLILQAGAWAVEKIAPEEALEIYRLFEEFAGANHRLSKNVGPLAADAEHSHRHAAQRDRKPQRGNPTEQGNGDCRSAVRAEGDQQHSHHRLGAAQAAGQE